MLELVDLHVRYGAIEALRGASLIVHPGEVVTVIGSNGAGKSTMLKAIAGLLRPSRGRIRLNGQEIAGKPAHQIVPLGISLVPEGRKIFADQTVWDNLLLGGYVRRREDLRERADAQLSRFTVLRERRHQQAGALSGGQQQMLAIARGLMARPKLLLLDEPSIGLAPRLVREVFAIVEELRQEGMTILLVEQMAAMALAIADRAYVLEQGAIVLEGSGQELLASPAVRSAYLGSSARLA
ncbi:MAG TPA: ABC transporter ATP-binding protein [Thermomicrobiales bacterium]|jgi:branched-chain amino acid transport system ATP-binding protein|nr:ABC transporter ATP-binding protein [Thermomicrobiales bacterium]